MPVISSIERRHSSTVTSGRRPCSMASRKSVSIGTCRGFGVSGAGGGGPGDERGGGGGRILRAGVIERREAEGLARGVVGGLGRYRLQLVAENLETAAVVLRVDGDDDLAEGAVAETHARQHGVLDLDVELDGGGVGQDGLGLTHEPAEHVDAVDAVAHGDAAALL